MKICTITFEKEKIYETAIQSNATDFQLEVLRNVCRIDNHIGFVSSIKEENDNNVFIEEIIVFDSQECVDKYYSNKDLAEQFVVRYIKIKDDQ